MGKEREKMGISLGKDGKRKGNGWEREGTPVIYITAKSLPLFIATVRPHFHSQMLYKLSTI